MIITSFPASYLENGAVDIDNADRGAARGNVARAVPRRGEHSGASSWERVGGNVHRAAAAGEGKCDGGRPARVAGRGHRGADREQGIARGRRLRNVDRDEAGARDPGSSRVARNS